MPEILIVEDSRTQAIQIKLMLEKAGYSTQSVGDGVEAMAAVSADAPDLILTDLHMPNMNGLELVDEIRSKHTGVPVILMTADGTDTIAVEALKKGAASYIPKRLLSNDLISSVNDVLDMTRANRAEENVFVALVESRAKFVFGNDPSFASAIAAHFEKQLRRMRYTDETGLLRISLAVREAILNAIEHGNLELDSKLRDDDDTQYYALREQRIHEAPYKSRQVTMEADIGADSVKFVVTDGGTGFEPSEIPDPTDPENLVRAHGRGLMLIQSFMNEVRHNESGNQITMVKLRDAEAEAA